MLNSFLPQGSTPQTSQFTCNTCGIKFVTAELQRQHMKTDWHRYNLKRRVAELPSISSDVFAEKILQQQQLHSEGDEEEDEYGFFVQKRYRQRQPKKQVWDTLRRSRREIEQDSQSLARTESPSGSVVSDFSSFSLGDSVHLPTDDESLGSELNYSITDSDFTDLDYTEGSEMDESEFDSEAGADDNDELTEIIPITQCLCCGKKNEEIENNVKHMSNYHGLYIPERSFLVDLPGLLTYLSEVISYDNECLTCGFQGKNLESIRQHMRSKGHFRIPYETKEEREVVAEFYNFNVDSDGTATKSRSTKSVAFADTSDEVVVDIIDNDINSNYSIVQIDKSGVELTLPSGSKVGHRTMVRYYRQNLPLPRDLSDGEKTVALVDKRFAPGITSKDIVKQEKETQLIETRAKNVYERRTKTKKANYQKHFRDEILGT